MPQKILINVCYGGFNLSNKAAEWLAARGDEHAIAYLKGCEEHPDRQYLVDSYKPVSRVHPPAIECVKTLGSAEASGFCAQVKIVEIPDGVKWDIEEYDGLEHVAEQHRTWY